MSRLSSSRSFRTTARSGIAFSLLIAVCGFASLAFGQVGAPSASMMGGPMGMGMGMGMDANQKVGLANQPSGIKRPEGSSLVELQALLYEDAVSVVRVDLTKIDYEGVNAFVKEIVEKAGGAVDSNDKYLVDLRKYQISSAKSSFEGFASALQNIVVSRMFGNKIDELYIVEYRNSKDDSCAIMAVPTRGLSDADRKAALEQVADALKPLTIFERFGFIIAVKKHDKELEPDLEGIKERFVAKMQDALKGQMRSSYAAVNGGMGGGMGANGMGPGMGMGANGMGANGMGPGMGMGANAMGPGSMMGPNGMPVGPNGQTQDDPTANVKNELGLPPEMFAAFAAEVAAETEKCQKESRRAVLPFVRRRFQEPATAENAAALLDALRQTDGCCVSIASSNVQFTLDNIIESINGSKKEETSFASVEDEKETEPSVGAKLLGFINEQGFLKNAKSFSLGLSLVGSPRIALIGSFANAEDAQDVADLVQGALAAAKPALKDLLVEKLAMGETKADMAPFANAFVDAMKPQVLNTRVASVVDLGVIKERAADFLPLLGATEAKSAVATESEKIDWNSAETSNATKASADDEEDEEDEDFTDADEEDADVDADADVSADEEEEDEDEDW